MKGSVIFREAAELWRQMRLEYQDVVEAQYQAAEVATHGHMVNARGRERGWSAYSVFMGGPNVVGAYASDELRDWLLEHPRTTLRQFEACYAEPTRQVA